MSSEYEIIIDDKAYKAKVERLDEGGILIVKVGEETFTIKTEECDDGSYTVNDTVNDFTIKLLKKTSSKLELELDDEARAVDWQRVIKSQAVTSPTPNSGGGPKVAGGIYPPMPGKITEVHVAVGDTVEEGQTVCILEAMKMFNELKASKAGKVSEVNVQDGSPVTPNDLIILIE